MRDEEMRLRIQKSLDAALSPLEPTAAQKTRMAEGITGGQKMTHKTRISLGLVLLITLALLAVGAAAAVLLSAQEVIEKTAVPMALENDTEQRKIESYNHDQLVALIRAANENGITLDESTGIMLALKKGEGYWEDEAIMEICREAFGGIIEEWTYDEQYWFLNLMGELNGYESDLPYPGEDDLTAEQAWEKADQQVLAAYPEEARDIGDQNVYRRKELFTTEEEESGQWQLQYQPNDLEHTRFLVWMGRDGQAAITPYPQRWESFSVSALSSAVNDAYRANTGTKSSWNQEAWHAFSQKLPLADRESGWSMEYDAYLQCVYPLPDASDGTAHQALEIALRDAGQTGADRFDRVLLDIDGRHVWKITLFTVVNSRRSQGQSWEIDARTGDILCRAVWQTGDDAWRAYVPESVYAAVREGQMTGVQAVHLAAEAIRTQLKEPDLPLENPEYFDVHAMFREWKQDWSILFLTRTVAHARAEAVVSADGQVQVVSCGPSAVDGDTLYQRYKQAYGASRWQQDTWVRFSRDMQAYEPAGWEGKLLKQTVYPEESSVNMTRTQAVDIAFAHNEQQEEEELDATLIGAAPHPVWKVVLSGDSVLWLYEIDTETGEILDKEAYKPDDSAFDNPLKRYTLHRDYAPVYVRQFGLEQLARIEVIKAYADMSYDEPEWPVETGKNGEIVQYDPILEDRCVTFRADQPGAASYRITFTEDYLTEKIEKLILE